MSTIRDRVRASLALDSKFTKEQTDRVMILFEREIERVREGALFVMQLELSQERHRVQNLEKQLATMNSRVREDASAWERDDSVIAYFRRKVTSRRRKKA